MRERFSLRLTILIFVVLTLLACAPVFAGAPFNEVKDISSLTGIEIREPDIALKYGVTGYLEITYPPDSPTFLSVDRGGEIDIDILLHFVAYTPGVTEAQVYIDPKGPRGLKIEYRDVIFNEFVSYNPSGNITIEAGETVPVVMSIRIPEDFPAYVEAIPLGAMGISAYFPVISELGRKQVAVH
jgi:hypothetical protein